jgi:hypothetical protein
MNEPMHKKVRRWLETKIENSKLAVDNQWKVEVAPDNEKLMEIDSPKMPFKLIVNVTDKITYTALVTTITFKNNPPEKLAPVYKQLLIQNKAMEFSKFYLIEDDILCLRTDLYTRYMSKKEFNHSMESVILGGRWLIAQLGQSEDENRQIKEMTSLGTAEFLKGASKEEVIAKIVKAGFSREKASDLVDSILTQLGLEGVTKQVVEEKDTEDEEDEKDNPVDRYIW